MFKGNMFDSMHPGSLKNLARYVDTLTDAQETHKKKITSFEEMKAEAVARLRKQVKAGESTGNKLIDMVLLVHGYAPDIWRAYAGLEEKLKGKRGEFMAVAFVAKLPVKFSDTVEYQEKKLFRLGVLSGEELVLTQDNVIGLPIEQYITGEVDVVLDIEDGRTYSKPEKGSMFDTRRRATDPRALSQVIMYGNDYLLVGDEEVREWMNRNGMPGLFKPAAAALSKLILEPTSEEPAFLQEPSGYPIVDAT